MPGLAKEFHFIFCVWARPIPDRIGVEADIREQSPSFPASLGFGRGAAVREHESRGGQRTLQKLSSGDRRQINRHGKMIHRSRRRRRAKRFVAGERVCSTREIDSLYFRRNLMPGWQINPGIMSGIIKWSRKSAFWIIIGLF